jgi:hypothetical protein
MKKEAMDMAMMEGNMVTIQTALVTSMAVMSRKEATEKVATEVVAGEFIFKNSFKF